MNEEEMREATVPTLNKSADMKHYIDGLVEQEHDYGTCVYAMSMAACAAYNYVAKQLGVTGFQASLADLDIIRRNRRIEGPFMLVDGEKVLYPQYDLVENVREAVEEWKVDWAREQAAQKLEDHDRGEVSPNVWAHWEELAQ